jgi:hypothetical protein
MSATIPSSEPRYLTAGDTWTWTRSLSDYSAADGWVLSYALSSATRLITITATASGSDHLVSVPPATTDDYVAGDYQWQSYVTKSGARYMLATGTLTVRPNLAVATAGYDSRSAAAKALAAIESYLTTGNLQAARVEIEGRAIQYHPLKDLYEIRDRLSAEVAREAAAAQAAALGVDPRRYQIRLGVD